MTSYLDPLNLYLRQVFWAIQRPDSIWAIGDPTNFELW